MQSDTENISQTLECAVQNIEDPSEALQFLYSITANVNESEYKFTTLSFNKLVHELAEKIDERC